VGYVSRGVKDPILFSFGERKGGKSYENISARYVTVEFNKKYLATGPNAIKLRLKRKWQ